MSHFSTANIPDSARVVDSLLYTPLDPNGLREALALFDASDETTQDVPGQAMERFFDRVADAAVGWIATLQSERLDGTEAVFTELVGKHPELSRRLSDLRPKEWLFLHLSVLRRIILVQRERSSAEQTIKAVRSAMNDPKRTVWRDILSYMHKFGGPIRHADLREAGFYNNIPAAKHALDRLCEFGLVSRVKKRGLFFSLTPAGETIVGDAVPQSANLTVAPVGRRNEPREVWATVLEDLRRTAARKTVPGANDERAGRADTLSRGFTLRFSHHRTESFPRYRPHPKSLTLLKSVPNASQATLR